MSFWGRVAKGGREWAGRCARWWAGLVAGWLPGRLAARAAAGALTEEEREEARKAQKSVDWHLSRRYRKIPKDSRGKAQRPRRRKGDGDGGGRDEAAAERRREHAEEAKRNGAWGEERAAAYLTEVLGWEVLARNVRYGPKLELDIVARQKEPAEVLVFVEVKTSRDERMGRPYARVDERKRRTQSKAALRYLRGLRGAVPRLRFDVVEVVGWYQSGTAPVIRRIENAFPMAFGKAEEAKWK